MKHTVELINTKTLEVSSHEIETGDNEDFMVAVENLRDEVAEEVGSTCLVHNITRGGLDG